MHGVDLDPEQKHKLLYCKTLAVVCTAVVSLSDDSHGKLEAGCCCVIANRLDSITTRLRNVER